MSIEALYEAIKAEDSTETLRIASGIVSEKVDKLKSDIHLQVASSYFFEAKEKEKEKEEVDEDDDDDEKEDDKE